MSSTINHMYAAITVFTLEPILRSPVTTVTLARNSGTSERGNAGAPKRVNDELFQGFLDCSGVPLFWSQ